MLENRAVVNGKLVRAYIYVSLLGILIPLLFALILAAKFIWPDFLGGIAWLQFGRLRVFHTNGIAFGWLGLSFFGLLNYVIPKLAGRPLLSEKLAWVTLASLVIAVGTGLTAILAGQMQGIEYAEFPWYADILFAVAFVMAVINYLGTTFLSKEKQLYVSSWYFILGLAFTVFNYVMANILPTYFAPGAAGAAITGLWIHNIVGLFVTPMGVGLVYFFIPIILKKPIYSHGISLLGFWTLAFFYPLGGAHHYFLSPIPRWVQVLAVPLTAVLFVVVVSVVFNWFMTLKGSWKEIPKTPALAFIVTGIFGYMATCTQGPFHAFLTIQKIIHFTDWVVAHAHMALFGAFTYWIIGCTLYIWPKVTGRELVSPKRQWIFFWLLTLGFYVFYFIPLTAAGLIQGFSWAQNSPFAESVIQSKAFWFSRMIGGVMMYVGMVLFARELWDSAHFGKPASNTERSSVEGEKS